MLEFYFVALFALTLLLGGAAAYAKVHRRKTAPTWPK